MVTILVTVALFAVGGVAAGWVWSAASTTPTFRVVEGGYLADEASLGAQFDGEIGFLLTAVAGGLACAVTCVALFRTRGLLTLLSVLLGSAVATELAYRAGQALGPRALSLQAQSATVGDLLSAPLRVEATGVLLAWPIASVVGVMLAVSLLTPVPESTSADLGVG